MDINFYIDDFERLLREKSEEFRMYPSKRIWHSIYNNVHPSRKWPSVAMSISLISAIVLMGYLNTNIPNSNLVLQVDDIAQKSKTQHLTESGLTSRVGGDSEYPIISNIKVIVTPTALLSNGSSSSNGGISIAHNSNVSLTAQLANINNRKINTDSSNVYTAAKIIKMNPISSPQNEKNNSTLFNISLPNNIFDVENSNVLIYKSPIFDLDVTGENEPISTATILSPIESPEKNFNKSDFKEATASSEDKVWIDNYALYNKPAAHRWANKLNWQLYIAPSVVYRMLYSDPSFGNNLNATPFAIAPANQDINNTVIQKPSVGLEMGGAFKYQVFKGVQFKGGLQLNYTRYNSSAFQNTHPVSAKLTMHDYNLNLTYEEYRTTPYSNKSGLEAVKLHNETFQLSLPVGADLKLLGNENLQWNLGLTIQPTYVITGKSYLISSDRRYYVKDNSMLNKWNLNAGFETFLSYKANGFTYQFGPQFRTQLFSTNSKKFAVEERLLGFGLKFGISKTIK